MLGFPPWYEGESIFVITFLEQSSCPKLNCHRESLMWDRPFQESVTGWSHGSNGRAPDLQTPVLQLKKKKKVIEPGTVVHTCNSST
jgi:hypothetical protein